jgi:phage repressor protein C with HTH and peptisase S24 domain
MKIEVSNGEIVDKLTILVIKAERISEASKRENILKELAALERAAKEIISQSDPLYLELLKVNTELWEIEDQIRERERQKNFDDHFTRLARSVYINNDRRAEIKKRINLQTNSNLIEEKSYEAY